MKRNHIASSDVKYVVLNWMVKSTKDDGDFQFDNFCEKYRFPRGGIAFGALEILEDCVEEGYYVMNGCIDIVFCWW